LLSSTFKIEENKVALFFLFEALVKSYRLFVIFSYFSKIRQKWGTKSAVFTRQKVIFGQNLFSDIGFHHKKAP
jgi:hypothetical protein